MPRDPVGDGTLSVTLAFAGTYMASGFGRTVVYATGPATASVRSLESRATSFDDRRLRLYLDRAVRVIATPAMICGIPSFGVPLLLGTPWRDGFAFAVGVIGNGSLGPREWLPVVVALFVFLPAEDGRRAWVRAHPR